MQEATTFRIFYDGLCFQHLATVLIYVFTLCYGPGLLFRGPPFVDSVRAGPGSILVLLESYLQTYMTYTIVECTVNKLLMMDRLTVRNM